MKGEGDPKHFASQFQAPHLPQFVRNGPTLFKDNGSPSFQFERPYNWRRNTNIIQAIVDTGIRMSPTYLRDMTGVIG